MSFSTNFTQFNAKNQFTLEHDKIKRETGCAHEYGGKGRFGFNSYNLLTFAILSYNIVSNIISNVNNNANNNNNNDNLLNFGSSNVAESSTSADNSNKNMLMITVPPAGPPVVVPTGKFLSNGTIILNNGLDRSGASWYLPNQGWKVFDNGTILYNDTWKVVGVTSFGYIDDDNQFKTIKDQDDNLLTWKKIRSLRSPRSKHSLDTISSKIDTIDLKKFSVKLPFDTISSIYNDLTEDSNSLPLVLLAISVVGPPIVVQIGYIVQNGDILLNKGIEINGAYWQSPERTLYENGTIVYKTIDLIDNAKIIFGSISNDGEIKLLPIINGQEVTLTMLKGLNIRNFMNASNLVYKNIDHNISFLEDLKFSFNSIFSGLFKRKLNKRSVRPINFASISVKRIRFIVSILALSKVMSLDNSENISFTFFCSLISVQEDEISQMKSFLLNDKRLQCFINTISRICNTK